jgi:hypothetical protein
MWQKIDRRAGMVRAGPKHGPGFLALPAAPTIAASIGIGASARPAKGKNGCRAIPHQAQY